MEVLQNKKSVYWFFLAVLPVLTIAIITVLKLNHSKSKTNDNHKIIHLEKVGEIKEWVSEKEPCFFWNIDDICFDDENNLYVADSGWNKIFKFNSQGIYMKSIGKEGQGPGEFLAQPRSFPLLMSFGNDNQLYVNDTKNRKISVFSRNGTFIKQFLLPYLLYDSPKVNSEGDIYLISTRGKNIIDCYDKNFNLKHNFLNIKKHLKYPFYKKRGRGFKHINDMMLQKIITKQNNLIVFSNISLTMFSFDNKHKIDNNFMINNKSFINDFKPRLKKAVKRGGFIAPFRVGLDNEGNFCLLYFNNSIQKNEMYRYRINDGTELSLLRFPEKIKRIFCFNNIGCIYTVNLGGTSITVYKI